jgi:hypothetical protein
MKTLQNQCKELTELTELTDGPQPRLAGRLTVVASAVLVGVLVTLGGWTPAHSAQPQIRTEQIQLQTEPTQPTQPQQQTQPTEPEQPQATCPPGGQCFADVPSSNPFYTFVNRLYQQDVISGYACGGPGEPCDAYSRPYYRPSVDVNRQQMAKFVDQARRLPGISITTASEEFPLFSRTNVANNGTALYGWADCATCEGVFGTSANGIGVWGSSNSASGKGVYGTSSSSGKGVHGHNSGNGDGVYGYSSSGVGVTGVSGSSSGVHGYSSSSSAVYGNSNSGYGVAGDSSSGYGVWGTSSTGWAGYFIGNVNVTGTCCGAGAGSYRIDHPLDPENKYLYHSAVQSAEMKNVYDGNVITDAKGEAVVVLPEWFEALNRDFRYQLTVIGQFAQAIVSQEIENNRFTIKTDKPNVKVSWLVTGIRHDPYAEAHRIQVEVDKPDREQGKYMHPTEWGISETMGIDYERRPTP